MGSRWEEHDRGGGFAYLEAVEVGGVVRDGDRAAFIFHGFVDHVC